MITSSRSLIAGNWKMYKDRTAAVATAREIRERVGSVSDRDIAIFPPFPFLVEVGEVLRGSSIALGAQNLYLGKEGAFTGEVSGPMLRSTGCRYVIVGHSERRHVLGESDDLVGRKVVAALESELIPILCVGEKLEERERDETERVIVRQLEAGLSGVSGPVAGRILVAYEPVWAIGTGRNATPAQAAEVHSRIRAWFDDRRGGAPPCILYGGSVNPKNIDSLMAQKGIDGVLVGGASLEASSFAEIVNHRKN
jgi:triosephosphate isomerase